MPYIADLIKDNVLMANEKGKVIAIRDYVKWLHCNYKLNLTTTINKDTPTGLSDEQLCSGNPLQTYLKK